MEIRFTLDDKKDVFVLVGMLKGMEMTNVHANKYELVFDPKTLGGDLLKVLTDSGLPYRNELIDICGELVIEEVKVC